jgi:tRNA threonylcarbamoyl adenosine modification protein YeaZ
LILCLDTSGEELLVAAIDGDAVVGSAAPARRLHQDRIVDAVEQVARDAGGMDKVEAIAVGQGPGSYTGLRVGLSTAAGLAYARRLKIFPLSSLAVAGCRADPLTPVLGVVGAGRGMFHAQPFTVSGERLVAAGGARRATLADLRLSFPGLPVSGEERVMAAARSATLEVFESCVPGYQALSRAARSAFKSGHALDYDGLKGDYGS